MWKVAQIIAWGFFWRAERPGLRHATAALFAAATVAGGLISHPLLEQARTTKPGPDGHAIISLTEALSYVSCRKYGFLGGQDPNWGPQSGRAHVDFFAPEDRDIPYSQMITQEYGSIENYCSSLTPSLNNENSTFLLDTLFLTMLPFASPASLAEADVLFRSLILGASLYVLAYSGLGLVPLIGIGWVAIAMIELIDRTHILSNYPTMSVVLLLSSVLVALLAMIIPSRRLKIVVPMSVIVGFICAFIYNLRTSYGLFVDLQIFIGLFISALWFGARSRDLWRRYGLAIVGATIGFYAFQGAFIWPLESGLPEGNNYPSHAMWHPIVLGLALPPNEFAAREGIRWDDQVAITLAKQVDPEATYLGPTYDSALRQYYFSLWEKYPWDMLSIYWQKTFQFSHQMVEHGFGILHLHFGRVAVKIIPDGFVWLGLVIGCAGLALSLFQYGPMLALSTVVLAVGTLCVSLEQIIVIPEFYPQYTGSLIIGFAALMAMTGALTIAAILGASGASIVRRRTLDRMLPKPGIAA